jgi:hypothetical protein
VQSVLAEGRPVRALELDADESRVLRSLQLLTAKPVLYVVNVAEGDLPEGDNQWVGGVREAVEAEGAGEVVLICSAIEAELAELDEGHRADFLHDLGLVERGLDRLIRAAYRLLGLITFFTTGDNESRAWTVPGGATAPEAAGTIHSDFQRGFIRAETLGFDTFAGVGSWKEARDRGLLRSEGKDYVVQDGDIMLMRFNV